MLAYVFWHRPRAGVKIREYEDAQRSFHARLSVESACFRVSRLPFTPSEEMAGGDAYEDWYLVEDWAGLGELNAAAVDAERKTAHDRAASMIGSGWASVYALLRGEAVPPAEATWLQKPRDQGAEEFLSGFDAKTVWRRQMVLGPGPELCLAAPSFSRDRLC